MDHPARFKPRLLVVLLMAFSLVLFTACSDDDSSSSTGATGATGATGSGETPGGELADEQVLRVSMNSEPGTIDPHLTSVANELSVARQLSTGLFTYNEALEVVPAIAAEMPTMANGGISEDGMTYTITLQETTWSDGSPLTADDFVYSTLRVLDPAFGSPSAWAFYDIVGAFDYNTSLETKEGEPAPPASEIEQLRSLVGVTAEDADTLVYTLEGPNPSFLNVLAHIAAVPVKQSVIEDFEDAWTDPGNHVGNGPFVLESWARGSEMAFGRNANWHGPAPTLTRIQVAFTGDDGLAYNSYVAGELDVARATTASLAANERADELVVTPLLSTYALFMNNASETFADPLVRQAFGSAIDRDAYVNAILQGAGAATTSWVPPGMPGYAEDMGGNLAFDVERARELLTEAGHEDGAGLPEINLVMIASDYNTLVGQFIERQLEDNLGVQVNVSSFDQGQYFDELFEGNYDITIQSWVADWPAPDNFLSLFHGEGPANFSFYSNPDYDDLLNRASVAASIDARLDLYAEAQELLLEDAGLAPLYNEIDNTYVKPTVMDLVLTGIDGALKGDLFFWKTKILAGSR